MRYRRDDTRESVLRVTHLTPLAIGLAASCALLQPRFEAVDPEYGYVDGCTDIVLQGAYIGEDATVTIGGNALLAIEPAAYDPDLPEHAQDVGYKYYGVTPPAPDMEPGYYDVVMTVPDEKGGDPVVRELYKGFYYLACPAAVHIDGLGLPAGVPDSGDTGAPPPAPIAPGDVVPMAGCGLDADTVSVELRDAAGTVIAATPLVSDCGTAQVHFTIPAGTPDGDWYLVLVQGGVVVSGEVCGGDTGSHTGDSGTDTGGAACFYDTPISIQAVP